ncbi:unnamed protein product [Discosporangium mesarthrocarpum]
MTLQGPQVAGGVSSSLPPHPQDVDACQDDSPPPPPLRFSSYSLLKRSSGDHPKDDASASLELPTGALFAPFVSLRPHPPRLHRQPTLCVTCSAYPSPFCRVDPATGGWRCSFCKGDNPCYSEDFIGSDPSQHQESYPEMTFKAVEFVEPSMASMFSAMSTAMSGLSSVATAESLGCGATASSPLAALGANAALGADANAAPAYVMVVDGNMREEALGDLADSMGVVLESLNPQALVTLVVFTGVVSVYRLGRVGGGGSRAAVAEVLPGEGALTEAEVGQRLFNGGGDYFAPVHSSKSLLCLVLAMIRQSREGATRIFAGGSRGSEGGKEGGSPDAEGTGGRQGWGVGRGAGRGWGRGRRRPMKVHRRKRCLGPAVSCALSLARSAGRPTSRLMVCLGGCPNCGPGAVVPMVSGAAASEVDPLALEAAARHFQALGERALEQGTGVDVFCGGSETLGLPALQALVAPTSGYVVIRPTFGEGFRHDMVKCATEQAVSHGEGMHGCVIDVRSSAEVGLTHVIGPASLTDDHWDVDAEAIKESSRAAAAAKIGGGGGAPIGSLSAAEGGGRAIFNSSLEPPFNNIHDVRGSPENSPATEPRVAASGQSGEGSEVIHRMIMGRADPRTSLALYFSEPESRGFVRGDRGHGGRDEASGVWQAGEEEDEEHVYFQFVVRQAKGLEGRVTRVITHRLPMTDDPQGFLQTVDPETLAVLVGKVAVLQATYGAATGTNDAEVEEARLCVDNFISGISQRYRELRRSHWGRSDQGQGQGQGAFDIEGGPGDPKGHGVEPQLSWGREVGGPEAMTFPRELALLPRQLFHLRRGPLLGPLLQNSDDQLCLRHLFLRGSLEDCLRMLEPRMLSLNAPEALETLRAATESALEGEALEGDGERQTNPTPPPQLPLTPVPVETLAMLPDRLLVLDTHDRIYIWSGHTVCGREFDPLRKACEAGVAVSAASRFPSASVTFLKDGSSWSRYLTSRLIPSHKDSIEQQLKSFPALASVPRAELEGLRRKLPPTDDPSYHQYFWEACDQA